MSKAKQVSRRDLRIFIYIWVGIFSILTFYPFLIKGESIRVWSLAVALLFALVGLIKPEIIIPFYRLWIKVGNFIGRVNSQIIIFIFFFFMITPMAIMHRLFSRVDVLKRKFDPKAESYWINREDQPTAMKNQF